MMTCSSCGNAVEAYDDGHRFCSYCAAPISDPGARLIRRTKKQRRSFEGTYTSLNAAFDAIPGASFLILPDDYHVKRTDRDFIAWLHEDQTCRIEAA